MLKQQTCYLVIRENAPNYKGMDQYVCSARPGIRPTVPDHGWTPTPSEAYKFFVEADAQRLADSLPLEPGCLKSRVRTAQLTEQVTQTLTFVTE